MNPVNQFLLTLIEAMKKTEAQFPDAHVSIILRSDAATKSLQIIPRIVFPPNPVRDFQKPYHIDLKEISLAKYNAGELILDQLEILAREIERKEATP